MKCFPVSSLFWQNVRVPLLPVVLVVAYGQSARADIVQELTARGTFWAAAVKPPDVTALTFPPG